MIVANLKQLMQIIKNHQEFQVDGDPLFYKFMADSLFSCEEIWGEYILVEAMPATFFISRITPCELLRPLSEVERHVLLEIDSKYNYIYRDQEYGLRVCMNEPTIYLKENGEYGVNNCGNYTNLPLPSLFSFIRYCDSKGRHIGDLLGV